MIDNTGFLTELSRGLLEDERIILCWFSGDPNNNEHRSWAPHPWRPGARVPGQRTNNYVAVSSFGRSPLDDSFRRQTPLFKGGLALMVDDVGTKVDRAVVEAHEPTARIETSPGNEQWWYFLREPCRDRALFDATIRGFIRSNLLGADPGMAGVNRVGRLPVGTNGKPKYNGWQHRVNHWAPDRRWTIEELRKAFNLVFGRIEDRPKPQEYSTAMKAAQESRIEDWRTIYMFLKDNGMVKSNKFRMGDWLDITCPWVHMHTDRADSGSAISKPSADNEWWGAFQCHHGHCQEKRLRDLSGWVHDELAERLDRANNEWTEW